MATMGTMIRTMMASTFAAESSVSPDRNDARAGCAAKGEKHKASLAIRVAIEWSLRIGLTLPPKGGHSNAAKAVLAATVTMRPRRLDFDQTGLGSRGELPGRWCRGVNARKALRADRARWRA